MAWTMYPNSAEAARRGVAWSARCDCYAGGGGHSPNSGRCGARDVMDPTHRPGEPAVCEECREVCAGIARANRQGG